MTATLTAASPRDEVPAVAKARFTVRQFAVLPMLVLYAALLAYPMGLIAVRAFTSSDTGEWTLANFSRLVTEPVTGIVVLDTLRVAGVTTLFCLVLGYVVSYTIARMPRWGSFLEGLVLIPLMTSVLVRAFVWIALLEDRGVVNTLLMTLGITQEPIQLVYNETGVLIGMVHVMLPLTIIPMLAVFRQIDQRLLRASDSLGASPWTTFWRVYLPLSLPGVIAGGLLCFVLSLGFYVTPAMLGGGQTMLLAQQIEVQVQRLLQLNQASALSLSLILLVLVAWALVAIARIARRATRKGEEA
ncbi:ABC transporter permease [Leucobacter massiliensis]|uniref:ABC transmembrane type-1 domain-containing protein n=1 Tax=Leucobacter massiliensis TaxID=1686285 RepID=A0A2S9QL24_9MICO|nr:ABC transporter permease [Leucobacter massiliensis]PRI10282.1 hypothetical protein B4915_12880 [Leucobacter massiliensis]